MTTCQPLLVACLCADWCGTCRDYRSVFGGVAAQFGGRAEFRWIDIEDQADALGDLDIETFPTLLIADGDALLFFGALTPPAAVLVRTLENALQGALRPITEAAIAGLPAAVRCIAPHGSGG